MQENENKENIKELFHVGEVTRTDYKEWLLYKHYAKVMPSVMHSYGIFDASNVLQGVCCYGTPANNHNNQIGDYKCIELVRLVVNEGLPKNTLSFFVTQTFALLPKPIFLISYADQGVGHHGYIYQATNWMYTGLGGGVDFYRDRTGKNIHSRVMSDWRKKYPEKTREEIAVMLGWETMEGTYKHRYFYILADKREKKKMLPVLLEKYPQQPYPKGENIRYDAGYEPNTQQRLF